ncbi:MAG: Cysteine synthase, partial [uncultured Solirubrobacteraceae bacterium]
GRYPDQHCGPRRAHADGPDDAPRAARCAGRAVRQARDAQPRRLGQGPDRRGDDRGRRARRADRAREDDDRRGDVGQHRHRARVRLRREGLRPPAHPPAGHEPRARGPAAPLRRPLPDHGVDGRDERGGRGRARARRGGRLLDGQAVREPGEPGRPLRGDGSRDLGGARGPRRLPGVRRRHGRDHHRHGSLPQGAQPGSAHRGRRARELARPERRAPRAAQDPGDRRGLRAARPRPLADRRGHPRRRRGRDRDRAPGREPGGRPRRPVLRRRALRRDAGRPARRGRGLADRHRAPRLGRALRLHSVLRARARGLRRRDPL